MKKRTIGTAGITALAAVLTGCGLGQPDSAKVKLDPSKPVSLTVWHYYNGTQQAAFDELVDEFNTTVGKEKGIYIEEYSQGSVADLEAAVSDSLNGVVGAEELPDMFSSYADTAYAVQQQDKLVDLNTYFSAEELEEYVDSYIQEGYIDNDSALYLFPIAKGTEILMVNKTGWEVFAEATGSTLDELATTEGITEVSKRYYEWTDSLTPDIADDGKAFYGRDSMSNYFVIGMKQMGKDIISVENGTVSLNLDKELIRRLWDNYYIPYINGYYAGYGRFRSDDIKTGDILAYTGSASSAMYFPDHIEKEEGNEAIDYLVLSSPIMEGGETYRVQQGAGMAVTKSTKEREYASCEFLRWVTQKEQNIKFVAEAAYLPVRKDANTIEAFDAVIQSEQLDVNPKAYDCLVNMMDNFEDTTFYVTDNFENGYNTRKVLDSVLTDAAERDKAAIAEMVAVGLDRSDAIAQYSTDEVFEKWYESFVTALTEAAFQ